MTNKIRETKEIKMGSESDMCRYCSYNWTNANKSISVCMVYPKCSFKKTKSFFFGDPIIDKKTGKLMGWNK
jgi:hypothetical protein